MHCQLEKTRVIPVMIHGARYQDRVGDVEVFIVDPRQPLIKKRMFTD
jgi:hypothetical protein